MDDLDPAERERRKVALHLARIDNMVSRAVLLGVLLAVLAVIAWSVLADSAPDSEYVSPAEPACQVAYCP